MMRKAHIHSSIDRASTPATRSLGATSFCWRLRVFIVAAIATSSFAAAPAPTTSPATASAKVNEPADKPTPRLRNGTTDNGWIGIHNRLVTTAKGGNIDLYFEGDSITDYWGRNSAAQPYKGNFDKHFAGWNAGDFGVAADRTEHVLWRITNGELDGVKPKVIVLLIGTNNLPKDQGVYAPKTPAEDAAGVKAILDVMRQKQPQAKILLISVFPREDKISAANPDYKEDLKPKVKELNALLAKFDDGKQIKFLDIYGKFLDAEGKLLPGTFADRLHPTEKGYDIWAEAMDPILTEWLGPRASTANAPASAPAK
ncbi:MAG TPA: GDSL-type esterase/lipase family protein [Phycisphaerae bacterium]|jgi:lysophospholipase L1-like esterase